MRLSDVNVGVIGLGLMGASFAWRLKQSEKVANVYGWDIKPDVRKKALGMGILSSDYLDEILHQVDLLVFAVPMRFLDLANILVTGAMRRNSFSAKRAKLRLKAVMDMSSASVVTGDKMRKTWGSMYVGFHPMAGKERGGIDNADPDLFREASCAIISSKDNASEIIALGEELALAIGAHPIVTGADEHDAAVAIVSHLPVMIASALVLMAARERMDNPLISSLTGGGFRDTTRVAGGPSWLGADMLDANRDKIRQAADIFKDILMEMLSAPLEDIQKILEDAASKRLELLRHQTKRGD